MSTPGSLKGIRVIETGTSVAALVEKRAPQWKNR